MLSKVLVFVIAGVSVQFANDPAKHLTISASCKGKCEAHKALARASLEGLRPKLRGGKNPGAVVCREALHGEVVVGRDAQGGENAFCRFKDKSLVDCGTLAYYARQNDRQK